MKKSVLSCFVLSLAAIGPASGAITGFTYLQTDKTTGAGTISAFSIGAINFSVTTMPAATVNDPGGAGTPAGYVGSMNAMSQTGADATYTPGTAVSIGWSGTVTATGTDGINTYTVPIGLNFLPITQNSGMAAAGSAVAGSDYGWNINYGDDPGAGVDTVSTGTGPRMAIYFGAEVFPNFQRYTQTNNAYAIGQQSFNNALARDGGTVRDAGDGSPPLFTPPDAFGRPLALVWAWRDQNSLTQGSILVNDMRFDGYFWVDENAVTLVPEPGSLSLLALGMFSLLRRRRC